MSSYNTAHRWVIQARGPASQHACADCGGRAAQWAYDHQDPKERRGRTGTIEAPYSTDPSHYRALCRSCHISADRGEQCRRGHRYEGDNLAYDRRGNRECVTCRRDRNRAAVRRYAAKRRALRASEVTA